MLNTITARKNGYNEYNSVNLIFKNHLKDFTDCQFLDASFENIFAVTGLKEKMPLASMLLNNGKILNYINKFSKCSHILSFDNNTVFHYTDDGKIHSLGKELIKIINDYYTGLSGAAGEINEKGEHILDLKKPFISPHFSVNLLIGDRTGFEYPLQTTPKSVIDSFGRGSFRAQAAEQVLATRWDMRPEENGFPSNRQFYITEEGNQLFFSGHISANIKNAFCIHSQNRTTIEYQTDCGLIIKRTLFIMPQYEGMPSAVEVQKIEIQNLTSSIRSLKIVYTGMFGSAAPEALKTDVIYSNVINQTKVVLSEKGINAISPDYYPEFAAQNIRFCTIVESGNYAEEFTSDYTDFIGRGTLEMPEKVFKLPNKTVRKNASFFALAKSFVCKAKSSSTIIAFTGLVNTKDSKEKETIFNTQLNKLLSCADVDTALNDIVEKYNSYASFLNINSDDKIFDTYVNNNLPFQVYYQTFVSRAFALTQKGYREIGFREIQDLFASMYYLYSVGKKDLIKNLLGQWAEKVFELGYAYHNFYYQGKEPGMCSDDQLWFVQAVYRYICLTGDRAFLEEEFYTAEGNKKRSIYKTLKAIIRYSSEISIGNHKLPLLDCADWNDCLKIDSGWLDGDQKQKLYLNQIEKDKKDIRIKTDLSESVMNGFLLKIAVDNMETIAHLKGDDCYLKECKDKSLSLYNILQEQAWKTDFFARVLINRKNKGGYTYIGAANDGFSTDSSINGAYYLNSFSWSILSGVASEKQIESMLNIIEKHLKTAAGFKLNTPHDLGLIADKDTATGHYFQGDRENGGVFKHASMMAACAMLKAAKQVKDINLKSKLTDNAYFMISKVMPYITLEDPYLYKGNPRFCTQYNNSETGENVGPILSGTAPWLTLTIMEALGIEFVYNGLKINPCLAVQTNNINIKMNIHSTQYDIEIIKAQNKYCDNNNIIIIINGEKAKTNIIDFKTDGGTHSVIIKT